MPIYITQHRRGTTERLQTYDGVIYDGELIVERCEDGTPRLRVGDGLTKCSELPYIGSSSSIFSAKTKSDFPLVGNPNMLYKAESEKALYQWNASKGKYESLGVGGGTTYTIKSFSVAPNTAIMGETVTEVVLTWVLSDTPDVLTIDGNSLDPTLVTTTLSDLTLQSNKTWTLAATWDETKLTKAASLVFMSNVYYGCNSSDTFEESFLESFISKSVSSTPSEITVEPAGKYIYMIFPSRFATKYTFKVGGYEGGFMKVATATLPNSETYSETYDIYRSDYPQNDTITISIIKG